MKIEFDSDKDASNVEKHGVSLARAEHMTMAAVIEDDRFDYGENRFRGYGYIEGVAHCLVFTMRGGVNRVFSLRRAHAKEMQRYAP